jgi:Transcriptional Coactivator p15 (PC4)
MNKVPQSSTRRNPRASHGSAPVVIKVFEPLRASTAGRLEVRVIEIRPGERRLDIRQYLETEAGFTGFTRRGVCLSQEEFDALLAQRNAIEAALDSRR